jgi:hypothetical protein
LDRAAGSTRIWFRAVGFDADSNFSVFNLDVVRPELDGEVELVLTGPYVVLPAVPGARKDAAFEPSFAQRALEMEAMPLNGVEASVAVGQRDLLVARLDGVDGPWLHVLDPSNGHELHVATLARCP